MKKTLRNLLLLSTVSIFTVSCEKDEPSQSGTGQSNNNNNERIVYVAGYQEVKGVKTAVLWKNGTPAYLTSGTHESQAYSVSVNGNDVYVDRICHFRQKPGGSHLGQ